MTAAGVLGAAAPRACPGCGRSGEGRVFSEERFDLAALDEYAFASRKLPEFFSHRLIECPRCELVYAPLVPDAAVLERAYRAAAFDSGAEGEWAARSYAAALAPFLGEIERGAALEVGCGAGAFLRHLRTAGFAPLIGLEPSLAAREAAPEDVRALIRPAGFAGADFADESLSLCCCFQTLEHLPAPEVFLAEARRALAPRGVLCTVTHDRRALLNRLLGRRSPIIDLEHVQLFSRRSLAHLLERVGYEVVAVRALVNRYPLRYWLRLSPLPRRLKLAAVAAAERVGLGGALLSVNGGNFLTIARKRAGAGARA